MRVLVCGGRDFNNWKIVNEELDKVKNIDIIISGGAAGADTMAETYADNNKISKYIFPAQWNKYGKKAGPIRNQQMLDEGKPDLVVAFPGGFGTNDMIRRSKKAGIKVKIIGKQGT